MENPVIEIKNLSKEYYKKLILDNISFDIKCNSINTIIGPNGSGKTTIIKIILQLEKKFSGICKVYDQNISYVSQRLRLNFSIPMTPEIFINLIKIDYTNPMLEEIFDFCAFDLIKNKDIHFLSIGQIQRVEKSC